MKANKGPQIDSAIASRLNPSVMPKQKQGGKRMDRVIWIADAGYLIKACPDNFDYLKLKAVLEKECAASISESFYLN